MLRSRTRRIPFCLAALAICWATTINADQIPDVVEFNKHIRPIFNTQCMGCHGGPKQASGLSFVYRDMALAESDSGSFAIVPGKPDESYLLERVSDPDPDFRMPPADHGPALAEREIALLTKWIEQGAKWQEHWSFNAPQRQDLPQVESAQWPRQEMDYFVLSRLEREGLVPSREADRREWLRRVSFDLIGLPPTIEEIEEFLADEKPGAYERVVDRLLASPRFGERWAAVWLDLARYADTMGYEKDPHRNIWPFRDWLIRALNRDLPYNDFTIKLLAGDLLPDASLEDRIATAFHRNTQTNTEGGTDDEEFRTAAVMDRVSTTWQVWGATTFHCCQCHSHPYDPMTQEDYYSFLSIFNKARDCDVDEEFPRLDVPNRVDDFGRAQAIDDEIRDIELQLHDLASKTLREDEWTPLSIESAESTGQTKLQIATVDERGSEWRTTGTVTARSMYTLSAPLPAGSAITALRIDSLPEDVEAALRTPEQGFVVTRLRAWVDGSDGESREVFIAYAACDDPHPLLDPNDVAGDNNGGWGAYPKQDRPRHGIFVFDEPVVVAEGTRLRLQLKHQRTATGEIALVINRGRLSVSTNPAWTDQIGDWSQGRAKLDELRGQRRQIPSTSMPVMVEQTDGVARETFVFVRGNWLDKGDSVSGSVPEVFPSLDKDAPADRLAVARWLVSGEHPLTSRVMVNRLWEQLFGIGIVETSEDFGSSGTPPSHPELLDHLALRFQNDHAWHVKPLLREIVLSATYRQTSRVTKDAAARDPRNRLLARGPRTRLTAEMVRDQALLVSRLLSDKMYGPSVMPPQPEGVWRAVYSGAKWETSQGEDRYRRAVYTYWRRTSGYPAMMTFDVPTREVCTVRRIATNTPLQPLVTLNDPAFVECATTLARRAKQDVPDGARQQIDWMYTTCTSEPITEPIAAELISLYEDAMDRYRDDDPAMKPHGATAEEFAMSIVAQAILNLDEALTR